MCFLLHRDQSCYDIIPLYNAMKKKVLSDSDEVSSCVLDIGIDRLEQRGPLSVLLAMKVQLSVTVREWGVLFSQLYVFLSAGKLDKNPASSTPLVQRA